MARRTRTTGSGTETYGAETLPVLIRLPDLTLANQLAQRVSKPAAAENVPLTVSNSVATAPDSAPPRYERDRKVTGRASLDRNVRTGGRIRRGMREDPPAGWLHGAKQFLVAAVLAGILFGVIVTIKEWNREAPTPKRVVPREQIEASMDFGQPELAPAANAHFDHDPQNVPLDTVQDQADQDTGNTLQGIVPAGMTSFDPGPSPEITTNSAQPVVSTAIPTYAAGYAPTPALDQAVAPDAAGYADGADQASGSYGDYPTTGVEPIGAESLPTGPTADAAWPPERVPTRPVRSADRGSADLHSRQR